MCLGFEGFRVQGKAFWVSGVGVKAFWASSVFSSVVGSDLLSHSSDGLVMNGPLPQMVQVPNTVPGYCA